MSNTPPIMIPITREMLYLPAEHLKRRLSMLVSAAEQSADPPVR